MSEILNHLKTMNDQSHPEEMEYEYDDYDQDQYSNYGENACDPDDLIQSLANKQGLFIFNL